MIKKEFKTDFISPIVICDIEISNEIKDKEGNWNYENSDIVTLGILYGNKITIYTQNSSENTELYSSMLKFRKQFGGK